MLLWPSLALAFPKAPDDYSHCSSHTAKIVLHSADQKRLDTVRALKTHLAQKGQDPAIISALYKAHLQTGVDFDLLVMKAMIESDLGRLLKSSKSSATGVFQYIDSTWFGVIKLYGERLGVPHYAKAIRTNRYGLHTVENSYLRAEILSMRYDHEFAALIKSYQTLDETAMLRAIKGSKVSKTDHYIAHMLGMPLAKEFFTLKRRRSIFTLASLNNPYMREAVRMNKAFFYTGGKALTASEAYKNFERRVNASMRKIKVIAKQPTDLICD